MTSIHEKPQTAEDRQKILTIIAGQAREIYSVHEVLVTCGCCKRHVPLWVVYRCYYCGVYFCKKCAGIHFG